MFDVGKWYLLALVSAALLGGGFYVNRYIAGHNELVSKYELIQHDMGRVNATNNQLLDELENKRSIIEDRGIVQRGIASEIRRLKESISRNVQHDEVARDWGSVRAPSSYADIMWQAVDGDNGSAKDYTSGGVVDTDTGTSAERGN